MKRYDFGTGCPPKIDFNGNGAFYNVIYLISCMQAVMKYEIFTWFFVEAHGVCSPEEDYYSPNIESSDDNYPSEREGDTDLDDDYEKDMVVPGEGEYPSFGVTLTQKTSWVPSLVF